MAISYERIDNITHINLQELTHEKLRPHYGTGRAFTVVSRGEKKSIYRSGVQCDLGDIELSLWEQLAKMLVEQNRDQLLLQQYIDWEEYHCTFHREKSELLHEAFDLYTRKMKDNKGWGSYVPFNLKYYPEVILQDPLLLTVIPACCSVECLVPAEQIFRMGGETCIPCPLCGRGTTYIQKYKAV